MKTLHPDGQVAALIAADIADFQIAGQAHGRPVGQLYRPVHLFQNSPGLRQEGLPRPGQGHRAGGSVKQGAAQGLLQKANLLGNGRLGDVKLLRRLGKAPVLRRGHKVL